MRRPVMVHAITWGGDPEDVCITLRGVGRLSDLDALWREAAADPRWVEGMRVLFDSTGVDWSGVTTSEMEERAHAVTKDHVRGYQLFAVVVRPEDLSFARLLGLRIDRKVGWVCKLFTSISEARTWLRHPHYLRPDVSRLTPVES